MPRSEPGLLCLPSIRLRLKFQRKTQQQLIGYKYKRRTDLEGVDSNLVIIDILSKKDPLRLINIYRSFNPPNNIL